MVREPSTLSNDDARDSRGRSRSSRPSRRALLGTLGMAASGALAGCNTVSSGFGTKTPPTDSYRDGGWHSFGNGPGNANVVDGATPRIAESKRIAQPSTPHPPRIPPVVHEDVVYFAAGTNVLAVTPDGDERWSRRLDQEASGAPAIDPARRRLYVPTGTPKATDIQNPGPASLVALSLDGGDPVRTVRVGDGRTYGVTLLDGDAYVRSATACVRLAPDGSERWRHALDPLVHRDSHISDVTANEVVPAVAGDGVYVPDRNALVKLDARSGEAAWRVDAPMPLAAPAVDDRGVVQTGWEGTIAVDPSGRVRWRRDLRTQAAAAIADDDVYVAADRPPYGDDLHELDAESGETNWQTKRPPDGFSSPVVTGDVVLSVTAYARAYRRDRPASETGDRERWETGFQPIGTRCSPVVAANHIFVVGLDGLLALRPLEPNETPTSGE